MLRSFISLLFFIGVALSAAPTFPELTGRVVDQAGLLTPEQEHALADMSGTIERDSTVQVVIVTLKSLEGYDIAEYGYQLARYWKVGQKDEDNGILIMIAPKDKKVRIEIGYGLEGYITDAQAHEIIQNRMFPRFKEKDVYGGLRDTLDTIGQTLSQEYVNVYGGASEKRASHTSIFYMAMIGFAPLLLLVLGYGKSMIRSRTLNRVVNGIIAGGIAGVVSWFLFFLLPISVIAGIVFFAVGYFIDSRNSSGSDFGSFDFGALGHSAGSISGDTFDVFSGGGGSFGGGGASADLGNLLDGLGNL